MQIERKIFKVSQINAAARAMLEANFENVWIEGEISNLSEPSSGHIYFTLKDQHAQIRAAMFRNRKLGLKFAPKNGSRIIIMGQVSLYEARGDYQVIVEHMEIAGTGDLYIKFLQLKEKLETEELFATKHKQLLPKLPNCIGIITSPTGAALQDILSVLKRRCPLVPVIIYPTQVQGDKAAEQIVNALHSANQQNKCDLLIMARGGGSIEDLWPFNEEIVARAMFACSIPIISAIGHETDFTIADFVADVRAPTPSVAAELAVPDITDWLVSLENLKKRLFNTIQYKLQQLAWTVENLKNLLHNNHPKRHLTQRAQYLDELDHRLKLAIQKQFVYWQTRLKHASNALELVSPLATLSRGYAITMNTDGKVISTINNIAPNDILTIRLQDGTCQCLAKSVKLVKNVSSN